MSADTHTADTTKPELSGRVTIAWPKGNPGEALGAWLVTIFDADTGEQIVDTTCLRLAIGDDEGWSTSPLEVELTRLVDADGQPIGASANLVPTDEYREHMQREREQQADLPFDGPRFLTRRFRYLVVGAPALDQLATAIGLGRPAQPSLRKGDEIVIRATDGTENRMRVSEVRGELPGYMEVDAEPAQPSSD